MGSRIADGVAFLIMVVAMSLGSNGVHHMANLFFPLKNYLRFFLLQ